MSDPTPPRYLKPMNKIVMGLQKLGIQTGPAMVLTVPGRKSSQPRSTPMSPFEFQGQLYTVAGFPRADWALNARAAGAGTLARPKVASGQDRRTPARTKRVRCCGRSRSRFRSASGSASARAWCGKEPRTSSRRSPAGARCSGSTPTTKTSPRPCTLHHNITGPVRTCTTTVWSPSAGPSDGCRVLRTAPDPVHTSSWAAVPSAMSTSTSPLLVCTETAPLTAVATVMSPRRSLRVDVAVQPLDPQRAAGRAKRCRHPAHRSSYRQTLSRRTQSP